MHETGGVISAAIRQAARMLSPGGTRGRLIILAYHRVLREPDPMRSFEVDSVTFDWQMSAICRHFAVLPLTEAIHRLKMRSLPPRALCVTFDDGYADNYEVAYPILKRWRVPATFFVATGYLDGGMMWNDQLIEAIRHARGELLDLRQMGLATYRISSMKERAETAMSVLYEIRYLAPRDRMGALKRLTDIIGAPSPPSIMMTSSQVRSLCDGGMEVGGHTVNHPILTRIAADEARTEIMEGKTRLESIVGDKLSLFAYPNGRPGKDYDARHVEMVKKAGFTAAVSTAWGAARFPVNLYQLPRIMPWDRAPSGFMLRLLRSYMTTADICPSAM